MTIIATNRLTLHILAWRIVFSLSIVLYLGLIRILVTNFARAAADLGGASLFPFGFVVVFGLLSNIHVHCTLFLSTIDRFALTGRLY